MARNGAMMRKFGSNDLFLRCHLVLMVNGATAFTMNGTI